MDLAKPDGASQSLFADLTCSLCQGIYDRPKSMPNCPHTFCFECLERLVKAKNSKSIFCPECRVANQMPLKVEDLPTNLVVQNIAEKMRHQKKITDSTQSTSAAKCSHFLLFDEKGQLCAHCEEMFCDSCKYRHIASIETEISNNVEKLSALLPLLPEVDDLEKQLDARFKLDEKEILHQADKLKVKINEKLSAKFAEVLSARQNFQNQTLERVQLFIEKHKAAVLSADSIIYRQRGLNYDLEDVAKTYMELTDAIALIEKLAPISNSLKSPIFNLKTGSVYDEILSKLSSDNDFAALQIDQKLDDELPDAIAVASAKERQLNSIAAENSHQTNGERPTISQGSRMEATSSPYSVNSDVMALRINTDATYYVSNILTASRKRQLGSIASVNSHQNNGPPTSQNAEIVVKMEATDSLSDGIEVPSKVTKETDFRNPCLFEPDKVICKRVVAFPAQGEFAILEESGTGDSVVRFWKPNGDASEDGRCVLMCPPNSRSMTVFDIATDYRQTIFFTARVKYNDGAVSLGIFRVWRDGNINYPDVFATSETSFHGLAVSEELGWVFTTANEQIVAYASINNHPGKPGEMVVRYHFGKTPNLIAIDDNFGNRTFRIFGKTENKVQAAIVDYHGPEPCLSIFRWPSGDNESHLRYPKHAAYFYDGAIVYKGNTFYKINNALSPSVVGSFTADFSGLVGVEDAKAVRSICVLNTGRHARENKKMYIGVVYNSTKVVFAELIWE